MYVYVNQNNAFQLKSAQTLIKSINLSRKSPLRFLILFNIYYC